MAAIPLTFTIVSLAGRATDLSGELDAIQGSCGHTRADVESVANEIAMLGDTLRRLHEAMDKDPAQFTESFNQDLSEIIRELEIVFEEISECSQELQKADSTSGKGIGWLLRRPKVHLLQKHLEALKTTLVVMRTVLHHGKEYGMQTPPTLAESAPHTLQEDRAILEAVFATKRNTIIDLHNLGQSPTAVHKTPGKEHAHVRLCAPSSKTSPIPEILGTTPRTAVAASRSSHRRSFSQRGMRLGVHMSILDMGAHAAPDALKNKWIQTSRSHHPVIPAMIGSGSADQARVRRPSVETANKTTLPASKRAPSTFNHDRRTSHGSISTPTAGKLHEMIDDLELSQSTGISKLVPHRRRCSSDSKQPGPLPQAEESRRSDTLASEGRNLAASYDTRTDIATTQAAGHYVTPDA